LVRCTVAEEEGDVGSERESDRESGDWRRDGEGKRREEGELMRARKRTSW
jgi:hypothetical protein